MPPEQPEPREESRYVPPPPSERSLTVMRLVFALLGLGAFVGLWFITAALSMPWRIALGLLVAAPFLLIPDLLRDKSVAPPGFKPRKWEDQDE